MPKVSDEVHQALTELKEAQQALARARRKLAQLTRPGKHHYLVEKEWQWACRLAESREERLLAFPGVVGCGLGFRVRKGERSSKPCLTVFVEKKVAQRELSSRATLPKTVSAGGKRLEIDVVELGSLERQIGPGDSIGPDPLSDRGTLGVFARDTQGQDVVALTAMHVTGLQAFPSQGIVSTEFQSPCPGTRIGRLRAGTMTGIDAAKLELVNPPADAATLLPGIGRVRGWRPTTFPGDQGTTVRLFGASSGFQTGTLVNPGTTLPGANLDAAILVEIQTQGGDSGCALVDPENLLLGFLVGRGSSALNSLAVFTPASLVLSQLGCDIPSV